MYSALDLVKSVLRKRNVGPLGKMKLIKRIGRGCNSSAWSAQFSKGYKRKIVKRIKLIENIVYCRFAWREALCGAPRKKLRGVPVEFIRGLSDSREELQESSACCISELVSATSPSILNGAQSLLLSNTFLTEIAVAHCLGKHVNPFLPSATFCKMDAAWTSTHYGNIAMQYAGTSLEDCINDLTLEELQSTVVQVLMALSWAQDKVHFKHHDLHTGNVYISRNPVPKVWKTLEGTAVTLPTTALKVIIADFGLSAVSDPRTSTRHCRVDYELLNIDSRSWGAWSHELCENEGYDFSVLLFSMITEIECADKKRWLKSLERCFRSMQPRMKFSNRSRPLQKVGIKPSEFLKQAVFQLFNEIEI